MTEVTEVFNQEQTSGQGTLDKERQKILENEGGKKLQDSLEKKVSHIRPYRKFSFYLSLGSLLATAYFTIAPCFVSKPPVIKEYEKGVRVTELLNDYRTYSGEILTRNILGEAIKSLESDLENLRISGNFEAESRIRENYLKNLKRNSYIGIVLTTIAGLTGFALERKEQSYEKSLNNLNHLQKYK